MASLPETIMALAAASQALSALPAGDAGRPALEAVHADLQAKAVALLAGPQPVFERWGEYRVKVTPGRLLGSGLTARVYLAERGGVPYALKRYASVEGLSPADQAAIQSAASAELTLWMQLRHPHIVSAFGEVEGVGPEICLALEYAPGASAKARMREPGAARVGLLPLDVIAWVARDTAEALKYLHGDPLGGGPVVHRDIKPGNIVFTAIGEAKLTDFGAAALLHVIKQKSRISKVGTVAFMAPEMHAGDPASPRSDVWMYGATLLCLLTGEELADDLRVTQSFSNRDKPWTLEDHVHCRLQGVNSDDMVVPLEGLGLSEGERGVWEAADASLKDLIQGCLRRKPKDRLSAEEVLAHPFVANVEARYSPRRPTPPLPWLPQWPFPGAQEPVPVPGPVPVPVPVPGPGPGPPGPGPAPAVLIMCKGRGFVPTSLEGLTTVADLIQRVVDEKKVFPPGFTGRAADVCLYLVPDNPIAAPAAPARALGDHGRGARLEAAGVRDGVRLLATRAWAPLQLARQGDFLERLPVAPELMLPCVAATEPVEGS